MLRATLLAQLIVLSAVGCSSDHGAVSRIPGTERAATRSTLISTNEHYAISLSPDERYLVFWEWGKTVIEARKSGQSYTRAVCIDLVTGERTGFDPEATEHTRDEHVVGADFVPQCWYNEKCYIPFRRRTLAFGPGSPRGVYADVPGELTCSDCAPRALLKKTIRRRLGSSWRRAYEATHRFSIPWKDGRFGDRLYHVDGSALYVREGDETTLLLEKTSRFRKLRIARLRVSPDESFVAYTLFKKIKAPIPLPDSIDEVHLLDLKTRECTLVGSYRDVGNYIWSSDSERLYYAANGQDPDDMGVYVVDVPKFFGRSAED